MITAHLMERAREQQRISSQNEWLVKLCDAECEMSKIFDRLRAAYYTASGGGGPIDIEDIEAVQEQAELLVKAIHERIALENQR